MREYKELWIVLAGNNDVGIPTSKKVPDTRSRSKTSPKIVSPGNVKNVRGGRIDTITFSPLEFYRATGK